MYILTILAMIGIINYRQYVLGQPNQQWDDIAMLMSVNVIILLGSVLYLTGGINPMKVKPAYLVAGYIGFVVLGVAFTVFRYTVLLGQEFSLVDVQETMLIVAVISGILFLGWGLLAYLGNRRIEKQIE